MSTLTIGDERFDNVDVEMLLEFVDSDYQPKRLEPCAFTITFPGDPWPVPEWLQKVTGA